MYVFTVFYTYFGSIKKNIANFLSSNAQFYNHYLLAAIVAIMAIKMLHIRAKAEIMVDRTVDIKRYQ